MLPSGYCFLSFFNLFSSLATAQLHLLQQKSLPCCPPLASKVCSLFPFPVSGFYNSTRNTRQKAAFRLKQKASWSLIASDIQKWEKTNSKSALIQTCFPAGLADLGWAGCHHQGFSWSLAQTYHFIPGGDRWYPAEEPHLRLDLLNFKGLMF